MVTHKTRAEVAPREKPDPNGTGNERLSSKAGKAAQYPNSHLNLKPMQRQQFSLRTYLASLLCACALGGSVCVSLGERELDAVRCFGYVHECISSPRFTVRPPAVCTKLTATNIFEAPEVPRKVTREEKIPVPPAKAPELPAPRGTCLHG